MEKYLKTDSSNIYYQVPKEFDNDKHTIFFLHGMTADHTMFKEQYEYFKEKYNVILWDAPAHGKSRPYKDFTYEKCSLAIKKIFEIHNIKNAVYIGQSMGGFIVQSVIKRFPSLVKGFVSIDSTPYGNVYYSK